MTDDELIDDKVKVTNHELIAVPIPKPKKGVRKIKPRKNAAGSMYSAAASEQALEESLNCLTPAKIGGLEEIKTENKNEIESQEKPNEAKSSPKNETTTELQ